LRAPESVRRRFTYRAALDSGEHELLEGLVENFEPARRGANTDESFTVNGVYFSYSDYSISPAFKVSRSQGGPIREGLSVRISYVPRDQNNAILKLEIPASELAASAGFSSSIATSLSSVACCRCS